MEVHISNSRFFGRKKLIHLNNRSPSTEALDSSKQMGTYTPVERSSNSLRWYLYASQVLWGALRVLGARFFFQWVGVGTLKFCAMAFVTYYKKFVIVPLLSPFSPII